MGKRIGKRNIDFMIGPLMIRAESATLSITDNTTATKTNGVPNGYIEGDVEAEGEIELSARYLTLLSAAAKTAGSYRDLPTFPLVFNGVGEGEVYNAIAHGCKLKISDLPDVDPNSQDLANVKIQYTVTSPDFVWINGVPYLSGGDKLGLF